MFTKHQKSRLKVVAAVGSLVLIVASCSKSDPETTDAAATEAAAEATEAPAEATEAAPAATEAAPAATEAAAPVTEAAPAAVTEAAAGGNPAWCGPKKITLGFTDGFGGNSWRLVTTAAAKNEASKCASVTKVEYADGQGDTQKAISDIQGMVTKGVNALVVFPDAGEAILPALKSAYEAKVVTVPYRVTPGGTAGTDFNKFIDSDFRQAGELWGEWIMKNLPDGGNVLMLSGPAGNSQGVLEAEGLAKVLGPSKKYTMIGEQPFAPTNWDPAETQKVLTAAIAKNPKIDVIVSDFGPSLVGALPEFEKSGRSIPALATSDGNVLSCFWEDNKAKNPDFKLMTISTQNDHARLAIQWAVALATEGTPPAEEIYPSKLYEDSVSSTPSPVTCRKDLPGAIYLSAEMNGDEQAKLVK
jgi:ribose transport system substrate-binding protein